MNRAQTIRQAAPHLVIALALCIGAWMSLVQPKMEALAQLSATQTEEALRLTPEQQWQIVQHVEGISRWLDEVHSHSALSRDSNMLFSTIMEIAESHGVQVLSVQPGPAPRQASRSRDPRESSDSVSVSHLEVVARGRFESVAVFIDSLTEHSPFIRPQSLQIAPASDGPPPTVSVRLTCAVLSFKPPKTLAKLEGDDLAP